MAADLYGAQRLLAEGLVPPALVFGHPGLPAGLPRRVAARGRASSTRSPSTSRAGPTASGASWERAPRRRRAPATRSRTASPSRGSSPTPSASCACTCWRRSSGRCRTALLGGRALPTARPRTSRSSRPAPTTRPTSSTPTWPATSASPSSRAATSTVRDDRVYLKTLTGLEPVHAILRRLDDDFCDPLELRADSTLGVPGLVQAWRAGHVLVANAFGTGVLESPALLGFLPAVCQRAARRAAGAAVDRDLVVRRGGRARRRRAAARRDGRQAGLSRTRAWSRSSGRISTRRAGPRWSARVCAPRPSATCSRSTFPCRTAPVWHGGRLESRALMLRVFLVADGRGDYRVMPGGLSRIAGQRPPGRLRPARRQQQGHLGALRRARSRPSRCCPDASRPDDVARSQRVVSSRAGENLFWLGRYAERSENGARLLRAVLTRLPDDDAFPPALSRPGRAHVPAPRPAPRGRPGVRAHAAPAGADLIAGHARPAAAAEPRLQRRADACAWRAPCATVSRPTTGAS